MTNASFLVAAFFAYRSAKRHQAFSLEITILVGLAATVGVGSFLFHTFATVWAMYLDIIPIFLLMLYFVWEYCRKQIGMSGLPAGVLLAGLLGLSLAGLPYHDVLNGSLTYVPAWFLLGGLGAYHIRRSKREPWTLLIATIVFLIALTFRTIDKAVCGTFPCGTHFLWHLLNGMLVYLVIRSLIVNAPKDKTIEPASRAA